MLGRLRSVSNGFAAAACLFFCLCGVLQAVAGEQPSLKGVALVIGQSDYQSLSKLINPEADARAMEERLAALGFSTDLALDEGTRKLKRTVSGFIEDAEGADVALVYYSGHAIEAGGVNYLIPADAGVSSLAAADETLQPLQPILEALRRKAKVTILLIDACRTNPFPANALVTTAAVPGQAISPHGLAATKGVMIVDAVDQTAPESLGEVVGYAAEPGQVALDGPAGANSPYAAALLKHLSANQAYDFGQVMTLVTEEVYLNTGTRQRPWTNASLRRFLTFGGKVEDATPDDARITDARRQLLITIAATPRETRDFVEALAQEQKQSLDLVYGMLKELQVTPTDGLASIERQLKEGVEQAKRLRAERDSLRQSDPRIIELARLAERADAEGALALAKEYWGKASLRTDELAATREKNKTDVMDRAREAASVYAHHAAAAAIAFDHEIAAREYGKAYKEVEWFDKGLAQTYRLAEAGAYQDHGEHKGGAHAFRQALSIFASALAAAEHDGDRSNWARLQNDLGVALASLGESEGDMDLLRQAVAAHEAALTIWTRERAPLEWAMSQNNLGAAFEVLGERDSGTQTLRKAMAAYEAALTETTREKSPFDWARTQSNLGNILQALGRREGSTEMLRKSVAAYEAALTELTRERYPFDWATLQSNFANALEELGEREGNTQTLRQAVAAYEAALTERIRKHAPLQWATIQNNLGNALQSLGRRENSTETLRKAVAAYEAALTMYMRDQSAVDWAKTQYNLGNALRRLGERENSKELLRRAVAAYEAALSERSRDRAPAQWAATQDALGNALEILGERENDMETLGKAVAAYEAALTVQTRERDALAWAATQNDLGNALLKLGAREKNTEYLRKAVAAFEAALAERPRERVPVQWAATQNNLGSALLSLGRNEGSTETLRKAVAAYETVLTQHTRERVPLDWARTQSDLGMALLNLGQRESGAEPLRQAVAAFEAALSEYTRERMPLKWIVVQGNLGDALTSLGEREGGTETLRRAMTVFEATLGDVTRQKAPRRWAMTQNGLGYSLALIGERTRDASQVRHAVDMLRAALEVQIRMNDPLSYYTLDSLCRALLNLGTLNKDRGALVEAKSHCLSALEGEKKSRADWAMRKTETHLAKVEKALTEVD